MIKKSILSGLIAGVLYALLAWVGNKFILDVEDSFLSYLVQGLFFGICMCAFYYLADKRKADKEKEV